MNRQDKNRLNQELEQLDRVEYCDTLLKSAYREWGNDFIKVARENKALLHDNGGQFVISLDGMQKAISRHEPGTKARQHMDTLLEHLAELESASQGGIAHIDRGKNVIRLSQPLMRQAVMRDKAAVDGRWQALAVVVKTMSLPVNTENLDMANRLLDELEPVLWAYAPPPARIVQALKHGNQSPGA